MDQKIMALVLAVAAMGATAARADHFEGDGRHFGRGRHGCGPRPSAPPAQYSNTAGSYQLQAVQTWVPGQQQQIFVPGKCSHHHRHQWQQCTPGFYRTVWTPGRYETQQQWVWVAAPYGHQQYGGAQFRYQQQQYAEQYHSAAPATRGGFHLASPSGAVSLSVY